MHCVCMHCRYVLCVSYMNVCVYGDLCDVGKISVGRY